MHRAEIVFRGGGCERFNNVAIDYKNRVAQILGMSGKTTGFVPFEAIAQLAWIN